MGLIKITITKTFTLNNYEHEVFYARSPQENTISTWFFYKRDPITSATALADTLVNASDFYLSNIVRKEVAEKYVEIIFNFIEKINPLNKLSDFELKILRFVQDKYSDDRLSKKTKLLMKLDLLPYIEDNIESFLFISSLSKGNTKCTHRLSEITKYEPTEQEMIESLFGDFMTSVDMATRYVSSPSPSGKK